MAIDAKVAFLNAAEKRLSTEITAETMTKVMKVIADVVEDFDMREARFTEEQTDDLLDSFLDAMKVQGRSQKTLDRYRYVIERMLKEVGVPTRRVTVYHLRSYIAGLKERGLVDQTLEGIRQVFTAYFNWLQRESLIERNPTANLGAIKCAKKKKKIYSAVDMEKLHNSCTRIRDRAIIAFLAATGCRIGEATELNRDSLDLERSECVVHGKGDKERVVYFDEVTTMILKQYLTERKDNWDALFVGIRGRMTPGGVRIALKRVAERAGVENVHPHKFRRTLATNMSRHGMPIQEVASILGHEKLDTTMKYVVLNNEDVKNAYRKFT